MMSSRLREAFHGGSDDELDNTFSTGLMSDGDDSLVLGISPGGRDGSAFPQVHSFEHGAGR